MARDAAAARLHLDGPHVLGTLPSPEGEWIFSQLSSGCDRYPLHRMMSFSGIVSKFTCSKDAHSSNHARLFVCF